MLYACTPPSSSDGGPKTYTTTVSGKITTPAGNTVGQYNTTARAYEPSGDKAQVWAFTDPATKKPVNKDGSYTLKVVGHSGTFQINVSYPAEHDYQAPANPQKVKTTEATKTQNIALKYGYTSKFYGITGETTALNTLANKGGVTVTVFVESREVEPSVVSSINSADLGSFRIINIDHPGKVSVKASLGSKEANKPLSYSTQKDINGVGIILP